MIGGGWRPTPAQESLLAIALDPGADGKAAWSAWRAQVPRGDELAIDGGTARLFPLLIPRIGELPADDPALPLIRGYYRRSVYHTQLLRTRAATVMQRLAQEGIPTLVLKGGVLGMRYYAHPGQRPMNDFDVLVPRAQAVAAIRVLLTLGWESELPLPHALPQVYHSACFRSPDGLDFDLHWHLLPEACFAGADDPAWEAAEPFAVEDVPSQALCPSDLLVVVCAHAAHWTPISPVRWVADALAIVRRAGGRIDWDRVEMQGKRWHVIPHLRDTLGYLAQRWSVTVPGASLRHLDRCAVGAIDRTAYRVLATLPGPLSYLRRPWVRYRLRTRDRIWLRALPGFVRYLQVTLGRERWGTLPGEIVRRYGRWRVDRARGIR
jgi:hypothetical protein